MFPSSFRGPRAALAAAAAAAMLSLPAVAAPILTTVTFDVVVGAIGPKVPVPAYFFGVNQPDPLPVFGNLDQTNLHSGDLYQFSITLRDLLPGAALHPFTIADVEAFSAPLGSHVWGSLWMPQTGLYSTDAAGKVTAIGFDLRDEQVSLALFKNLNLGGFSNSYWAATHLHFGEDPDTGAAWEGACGLANLSGIDGTCFIGGINAMTTTVAGDGGGTDPGTDPGGNNVPEPASIGLLALGLLPLLRGRRRAAAAA